MTYPYLSDHDIAAEFLKVNLVGDDAGALVRRVRDWLGRAGLQHRDPYGVAEEALRLDAAKWKPAPTPAPAPPVVDPAEAARLDDLRQGIGDQQPPTADQVRDMSMQEFAALRARIGLGQTKQVGVLGRLV